MLNRFTFPWLSGIILLCLICFFRAERIYASGWDGGISLGVTVYIGNKTDRVGVFANGWLRYDFIQVNPGIRLYYNFKNLGPPGKYWECDMHGGLVLAWGGRDSTDNPFVSNISNQTMRKYSFGYSYNYYCDGIGTSQRTGTIALQLYRVSLITENDLFASKKDRFRTAAASLEYRYKSTVFGISTVLWTGEKGRRILDSGYPARNGYKELERYGRYSGGLLSLQVQQYLGCGQNVRANAGIDSERVRHVFQNKLIHDMAFLPGKWVKSPSSHVPMLDADGNMYLYHPGQEIKKPSPYFNLAANPALFY